LIDPIRSEEIRGLPQTRIKRGFFYDFGVLGATEFSVDFRRATATGRAKRDPTGDPCGALPAVKPEHFAAITDPKRVGALMRAIDGHE
jgi:hypothetical protein